MFEIAQLSPLKFISILSTKADTKSYLATTDVFFVVAFFILTTNFTKNGYLSDNSKPLYIHFFGKTKSFT